MIVELISNLNKRKLFRNARLLKGTGLGIADDLQERERRERKLLYEHYRCARKKGYPAKLRPNTVTINGKSYKYEDLSDEVIQHDATFDDLTQTTQPRSESESGTPKVAGSQGIKFDQKDPEPGQQSTGTQLSRRAAVIKGSGVATRARSNSKSSHGSDMKSTKTTVRN